jgi:hypothetical protein
MIRAVEIENFKGIRERVKIDVRPLTLLFGANSAGKSSILHALHYGREVFLQHNLDADRTQSAGSSVDLGGFRNLIHNHRLDSEVRFHFEMEFNGDLPCSWDPDDEYKDPEYVYLSHRIISTRVGITIRWSELALRPFVSQYSVDLNWRPFAVIKCDAPRRNIRIAELDAQHPVFFDWTPARTRLASPLGEQPRSEPPGVAIELPDALQQFTQLEGAPFESRKEDAAFFPNLLAETQRWVLPVGEPGSIGIPDEEDALLHLVHEERFSHIRIATKYGEGEQDWGDDEYTFFEMRPKLSYLTRILHNLIVGPGHAVREWLSSFRSLGPIRETPSRDYQPPRSPDPTRWASGLGAWDRLVNADADFVAAVSHWLGDEDRLNSGYRLRLKRFKELDLSDPLVIQLLTGRAFDETEPGARLHLNEVPTQSRLLIVPTDESIELSPSDVGIGISQVVPVIVSALDGKGNTVAIEQPELHLHPAIQVRLGELFIQQIHTDPARRYLIETHSEHLLLRLLRRIRETTEGALPPGHPGFQPEQVSVVYLELGGEVGASASVRVRPLRIDETGEFRDQWPHGFFEERAKELF